MRGLGRAVEWLRPFVDSQAWDYCVVWKLGDDPSRFIQWLGCCCSGGIGGSYEYVMVKEESGEEQKLSPFCRDDHFKHAVRTKACEALAQFPSIMDLYSGIHGEVVITNQPKWINLANASEMNPSHQSSSTRVLVPVLGGLIELFAAEHVPKDQNIVELVLALCNTCIDPLRLATAGSYSSVSFDEKYLDLLLEEQLQNLPSPFQLLTLIPTTQDVSAVTQFSPHTYTEGSSSGSNPAIEHPSFGSNYGYIAQNVPNSCSKRLTYENHKFKEQMGSFLGTSLNVAVRGNKGNRKRLGNSKNLITERNRRKKLKDGLYALRALVPKISKMDRAAILGDAAEYIKELEQEVDKLHDELKKFVEADLEKDNVEMKSSKLDKIQKGSSNIYLPPTEHNKISPFVGKKGKAEVQVEVSQIDNRDFLVKLLHEHERGGFVRLMEAVKSLELEVIDANVTTFDNKVLNILRVQAHNDSVRLQNIRETLTKLTSVMQQN